MAANALPLRNGHFRDPPSLSSARQDDAHHVSSFGYMLMANGMDEDPLSPSLVSPPPVSHAPSFTAGQMRPLPHSGSISTTLPMRNPSAAAVSSRQHRMMPSQPFQGSPQRTPSVGSASEVSSASSSRSSGSTENEKPLCSDAYVNRKDVDGDCSICWEPFEQDQNELIWCKLTCGNNFHKKCFVEWLLTPKQSRTCQDLKCPYCRGAWDAVELRKVQIENGITPPRPYKRARADVPVGRSMSREQMRRQYRERREQARRELTATFARANGGDRYRPAMPPQQPNYHGMSHVPPQSMRSAPGASTSTPHALPPRPMNSTMYMHQPHRMPHGDEAMGQRQPMMPMPFGAYVPQTHASSTFPMANAGTAAASSQPSHDLRSPGFNAPTFAPNSVLAPMAVPQQWPMAGPQVQPHLSRCPAVRAQQLAAAAPSPRGLGMGMSTPASPPFCPSGMMPANFEVHFNQIHYHTNYQYFGSHVP